MAKRIVGLSNVLSEGIPMHFSGIKNVWERKQAQKSMEKWDEAFANMVLTLTTSSKTLEEVTFRERRPEDWQEEDKFCKLW